MTPEKILELAAQNETDTFSERVWAFGKESLIAFAQSILEADRESDDEPYAYLWTSGKTKVWLDEPRFPAGIASDLPIVPVYKHPPPARKLTDREIDDVISKQRFFYGADANAYTFARAIERRINGEEE